jgi:GTP-binding protein HflX
VSHNYISNNTSNETAHESGKETAILFSVLSSKPEEGKDPFEELKALCDTAGVEVKACMTQVRKSPVGSTYLGKGKVEELKKLIEDEEVSLAICDAELNPVQGRTLERALGIRIVDRSELILAIFSDHAKTKQARLQVELARRQYELPRLKRMWTHLHRERGGTSAMGGMGEKQIEVDRRLMKGQISTLKKRLKEIEKRRAREVRSRGKLFRVSLVGYTNAGKSSLMNRLTGACVLAEDQLFATLDTRTRRWDLGEGREVLLSDTVGFIRDIPHHLVASFHATLSEALEADLLLVVADASDPDMESKLQSVHGVLESIGASEKEQVLVLNKMDLLEGSRQLPLLKGPHPQAIPVSAFSGEGLDQLTQKVREVADAFSKDLWIEVPYEDGKILAILREKATVLEEEFENQGVRMKVRISPALMASLESRGVRRLPA